MEFESVRPCEYRICGIEEDTLCREGFGAAEGFVFPRAIHEFRAGFKRYG